MIKRVPRSREDLEQQLREQLGFLTTSCRLYDSGEKPEAKRLAATLRTLLHDTRSSHSLLAQLGLLGLGFTNTNLPFDPRNLAGHNGLLLMKLTMGKELQEGSFEPRVLGPPGISPGRMPFQTWWEKDVILVDESRTQITRRDVVLFVANQDGGSHVDPDLDAVYHALSRGQAMGWKVHTPEGERPMSEPTAPCLRQIAYEVLETLAQRRQISPFDRKPTWYPKFLNSRSGAGPAA
jgi:hypothetical protein